MLKGIAASAGIGIGKAVVIRPVEITVEKRTVLYLEEEKRRFLGAVEVFVAELEQAQAAVLANVGEAEAAILGAQIAIMQDPELIKEVLRTIERQRINAEYAFQIICNGYIALFSHLEDEVLASKAADFRDIRDRVLRILMGIRKVDLSTIPADSILVAEDIPPSQAANINTDNVRGILTKTGTRYSHIAIMARALNLPAVVSVEEVFDSVVGDETLILDGYSGAVYINPCPDTLREYKVRMQAEHRQQLLLAQFKDRLTVTADNKRIHLASNYSVGPELESILDAKADGIGLFRTEFLFMERAYPPGEQEQYEVYRRVVEAMNGKSVVIRTLDVGGDKDIPYLNRDPEQNPFLGYRAIRFSLDKPEVFRLQIAAILRAAVHGNVKIMAPMISSMCEVRAMKAIVEETAEDLRKRGIPHKPDVPLGIMVETPAAALCAADLARECAFFSIGTNDLTQYILAVDRGNTNVVNLYTPLHPAVLRAIAMTVEGAHQAGIPVCVCGEAASDHLLLPFLIGVGVDELSVATRSLLAVRSRLRNLSYEAWRREVPDILALSSKDAVKKRMLELLSQEE